MGGFFDDFDLGKGLKLGAGLFDIAGNAFKTSNKASDQDAMADYVRAQTDRDYQQQLADYEYAKQASAASAANSRAAAAAANATEANRMAAAAKGQKALNKGFKNTKAIFDPYVQAGNRLLPQMEGAYSLGNNSLMALLSRAMAEPVKQSAPAWLTGVPIPKNRRGSSE